MTEKTRLGSAEVIYLVGVGVTAWVGGSLLPSVGCCLSGDRLGRGFC